MQLFQCSNFRPRKFFAFAAVVLMVAAISACNNSSSGVTNPPTPSPLARSAADFVARSKLPGVAVLVIDQGGVDVAVAGKRDLSTSAALALSDPIRLGSNSKALTAVLIARLVERGKLRWDSTLTEVLGSGFVTDPSYAGLTVEMLLRHQSGLPPLTDATAIASAIAQLPDFGTNVSGDQHHLIQWALQQPARFAPGSQEEYGNVNYILAGLIAEQVGGADYPTLMQREVFAPLGIAAQIGLPTSAVVGHTWTDGTWTPAPYSQSDDYLVRVSAAAGGWAMPIGDYAKFLKANIDGLGGRSSLLSQTTYQRIHGALPNRSFGMDWLIGSAQGDVISAHQGSDDRSYETIAVISQNAGHAVALFINAYSADADAAANQYGATLMQGKP